MYLLVPKRVFLCFGTLKVLAWLRVLGLEVSLGKKLGEGPELWASANHWHDLCFLIFFKAKSFMYATSNCFKLAVCLLS